MDSQGFGPVAGLGTRSHQPLAGELVERFERKGVGGVLDAKLEFLIAVDVRADIRPLRAPQIVEPMVVDGRPFDRDDVRTIQFDEDLPSRYEVGRNVTFSGSVKATDRNDISSIVIRFWKYGGNPSDAVRIVGGVDSRARFRVDHSFNESQRGVYLMEVFLFWPGSGFQYSRASLSPILIE